MDFAARIVTCIMSGETVTVETWGVQRYLEAVDAYRLFRYGRVEPLTVDEIIALGKKRDEEVAQAVQDMGLYDPLYPHGNG